MSKSHTDSKHSKEAVKRPKLVGKTFEDHLSSVRALMRRQRELAARADAAKNGYFDVKTGGVFDAKTNTTDQEFITKQLIMVRQAAKDMLGGRSYRTTLIDNWDVKATVTTGAVNAIQGINPQLATEFASFAAVFDEYRCLSGRCRYVWSQYTVPGSTDNAAVIAFDPSDPTPLATTLGGMGKTQHQVTFLPAAASNSGAASLRTDTSGHSFDWKASEDILDAAPTGVIAGSWSPTVTTTVSVYGVLKIVATPTVPAVVTNVYVFSAYLYMHTQFRFRV